MIRRTVATPCSRAMPAPHLHLHLRARRPAAACALLWPAQRRRPAGASACRAWRAPPTISRRWPTALAGDPARPRRVIALDYRGRGQSDYDRDPANYSFQIELADVLAVMTALDCLPAMFVGTSRGGILTMLLAALRPTAIAGVRAQRYRPGDRAEGADAHQGLCRQAAAAAQLRGRRRDPAPAVRSRNFPSSRRTTGSPPRIAPSRRKTAALVPTYDVALAKTMEGVDFEQPLPPLWAQFDALARCAGDGDPRRQFRPAVGRDGRGDGARHPALETLDVPDQGHAPLLAEADVIARIAAFAAGCERKH